LKPEEVRRLLEGAPDDLRALLTVAVSTGARRGELLALRWRDIRGNCITFQADTTKTGEGRRVFLNPRAVGELEAHRVRLTHAGPDGPVFQRCQRTGSAAATDVEWLSRRVRDAFEAAGLDKKSRPDLRPGLHLLRRTAATIMIQSGEDALTAQRVCGWKSPAMLQRYVGTDDNARRGAADRLGSALW
jgi:integrase